MKVDAACVNPRSVEINQDSEVLTVRHTTMLGDLALCDPTPGGPLHVWRYALARRATLVLHNTRDHCVCVNLKCPF